MKKNEKILILILVAIAVIMGVVYVVNNREPSTGGNNNVEVPNNNDTKIQIGSLNNVNEMTDAIQQIYTKTKTPYSDLKTTEIDVNDRIMLGTYTGLASKLDIEAAVVSESETATEAYALVMVKVAEVGDIENLKNWMLNNINTKRWVKFEAEKVYVTNFKNTIFLVMGKENVAKEVYNTFKTAVDGLVGTELQK